jgi:membrane protease subunit (stomatin/prohibitin family)
MALMDFIKKQFIDVIHWTEEGRRCARLPLSDAGF